MARGDVGRGMSGIVKRLAAKGGGGGVLRVGAVGVAEDFLLELAERVLQNKGRGGGRRRVQIWSASLRGRDTAEKSVRKSTDLRILGVLSDMAVGDMVVCLGRVDAGRRFGAGMLSVIEHLLHPASGPERGSQTKATCRSASSSALNRSGTYSLMVLSSIIPSSAGTSSSGKFGKRAFPGRACGLWNRTKAAIRLRQHELMSRTDPKVSYEKGKHVHDSPWSVRRLLLGRGSGREPSRTSPLET
jgi:hypothetical protein